MHSTWKDETKVDEYLGRVGRQAARRAGEKELVAALPPDVDRVLDLGCGDGRLLELVLGARPGVVAAVGLDHSAPMLTRARGNFAHDPRVALVDHDLADALPALAVFDAVVSGFAIHHLEHERKRTLFAEIVGRLRPGGVFANLEVVACATPERHDEFNRLIGRPDGDPEDRLAGVEEQLRWMRAAGLEQVDCQWRWRGFALLVGVAPTSRPAIRTLRAADRAAAVALWQATGLTRPWNPAEEDFDRAVAGPASAVLGRFDGGELVATAMVGHDGHRGWVYYVAVAPGRRGSGLGAAIMADAEAWLRECGVVKLNLLVRRDNAAAVGFYQRLGYEVGDVVLLGRSLR